MLNEYRDIITEMKKNAKDNGHFMKLYDNHNKLDEEITEIEKSGNYTDVELLQMKKEKLKLKDELAALLHDYKKNKTA